ncbi:MAG: histidine--tRNA ligase [Planctomycetes bacterium]|nr:histidine--tRNA ligase [Planctomycetota bacterium]
MPPTSRTFRAPRGTRDAYPEDALKRRYITQAWRDASIRHGFDEIEGPTFEHLELYTQKSGDEIVSQLFSFRRQGGDDDYALRPEFTPTLARMYAARANSLPKPTKWFTAGPYFRAEKPQRGRLREFLQWNCDIMGDDSADADAELILCCIEMLKNLGFGPESLQALFFHRRVVELILLQIGLPEETIPNWIAFIDCLDKRTPSERLAIAAKFGASAPQVALVEEAFESKNPIAAGIEAEHTLRSHGGSLTADTTQKDVETAMPSMIVAAEELNRIAEIIVAAGMMDWCAKDHNIVRGLAYYTGMVFEVIAEGERTVCGGGRYDNLIELFGGPPTPAVGFGMGDVVLSLLLEDKGLMPQGKELLDAVSRQQASVRPDAFVITADEQFDRVVKRTVATLRAGCESEAWLQRDDRKPWDADRYAAAPLHARRSYKATRHIGKLLKDATSQHARHAVIIESDQVCNVKDLDTGEQRENIALTELPAHLM